MCTEKIRHVFGSPPRTYDVLLVLSAIDVSPPKITPWLYLDGDISLNQTRTHRCYESQQTEEMKIK